MTQRGCSYSAGLVGQMRRSQSNKPADSQAYPPAEIIQHGGAYEATNSEEHTFYALG